MRAILALIVSWFFMSAAAYAQSPAGAQETPPAQHQPGAAAKPAGSQPQGPQTLEPTAGKVDPAKEAAIRHLMEITGTSKLADQILGVITTRVHDRMAQRGLSPDRLQKFMDTFGQDLRSRASSEQIDDAIIPIYSQHFSLEDIQGMTQFYESPLGQRAVKIMPQIYQEAQKAGGDLGQKGMLETLRGMTDEYPELKSMLPPEVGAKPTLAPSAAPAPVPSPPPTQQPPSPNPPRN